VCGAAARPIHLFDDATIKKIPKKRVKFEKKKPDCGKKFFYFHNHKIKNLISGKRAAPGYFWGSVGHFCMNFWLNRPNPVFGRDFELSWFNTQNCLS